MATDGNTARVVPLTCHGHSRPVTHLNFSSVVDGDQYYLISACKDNNPMLRDGITGDWIGTFIGHKGAAWSSRLSSDATLAATGSADFTAKIWDPQTGECLHTLQHNHIVKAVAFPVQNNPGVVATGGAEKKLRIFDLSRTISPQDTNGSTPTTPATGGSDGTPLEGFEIGAGEHTGGIKSIVWNTDYNIITTAADDKAIRWWDLRQQGPVATVKTEKEITSCELSTTKVDGSDAGIISVAAGHTALFFDASKPGVLAKKVNFDHDISAVAINPASGTFVTGGRYDNWLRVWDFATEKEMGKCTKSYNGTFADHLPRSAERPSRSYLVNLVFARW
jgi:serine-threonine kinase receptor-associated protein